MPRRNSPGHLSCTGHERWAGCPSSCLHCGKVRRNCRAVQRPFYSSNRTRRPSFLLMLRSTSCMTLSVTTKQGSPAGFSVLREFNSRASISSAKRPISRKEIPAWVSKLMTAETYFRNFVHHFSVSIRLFYDFSFHFRFPFCQNKRLNPMASIPHFHRDIPARRNLASTRRLMVCRRQHLA
jgi:hypothetical protein